MSRLNDIFAAKQITFGSQGPSVRCPGGQAGVHAHG